DGTRKAMAALILAVGLGASSLGGQEAEDELVSYRLSASEASELRLDGILSESFWSRARPASDFRQREPFEGRAATEPTEVRVAYDDDHLYIGIRAFDSEPDAVVARILQRDKIMEPIFFGGGLQFAGDDGVAVLLDPFHDHRTGIIFATNPNGAEFDALMTDEGKEVNIDWRAVWEVDAARTPDGWSAEFAIPWRTLRYPGGDSAEPWGLNVFRTIRRKNEETYWRSWHREGGGLQRVSRAGHLVGLEGLPRPGLNLEAKPYVLTGRAEEAGELDRVVGENRYKAGLDLKTELRPGLVLDLTVNTDFAQVEVDDQQVNLTRFDLFFPEKRDFFLENSGIFEFGVPGNPFEPPPFLLFFSRRIGIGQGEGEVPILAGARLTGRVGSQTVGLLSMFTDEAFGRPRESFSVARVKRDVGESSYVGGMVTDRRSSDAWNTATGADAQFVLADGLVLQSHAARTFSSPEVGAARSREGGTSYRVALDYTGDRYGLFLNHLSVSPDLDVGSGFVVRKDLRRNELFIRRRWRPGVLGLRKVEIFTGGNYLTGFDWDLQDWTAGFFLTPEWESGESFSVFVNAGETVLEQGFELSDSVDIPAGRFRADHIGWFGGTSRHRWISLQSNGLISRFYGGHLVSAGGTLSLAPSPQVAVAVGYTRNRVDVPRGGFTADISTVRASYSFSTKLSANVLMQYNSLARALSTNVRLNFIHRPGSDLFIVFTDNRGRDGRLWNLVDRGLVMKLTYLMRM
ncbi:MAG: DUF5916 domain-containing protein, partial [Gemmatimonadota bacterium]